METARVVPLPKLVQLGKGVGIVGKVVVDIRPNNKPIPVRGIGKIGLNIKKESHWTSHV